MIIKFSTYHCYTCMSCSLIGYPSNTWFLFPVIHVMHSR